MMLKRLSTGEPMLPFPNAHQQARSHRDTVPLPVKSTKDPVMERIDTAAALDFLFSDGPLERPLPRNRFEELADWFNDVVMSRFRRGVTTD